MAAILDDPRGMTYGTSAQTEEQEDVEILDDDAIAELDACVAEQQDVFSESFAYDGDDGMPPRTADGSSTGQTAVSPSALAAAANSSTFSATSTAGEVVIKRDIPYTADTSIDKLKLDMYIPFSNPLLHQQPSPPPQTDVTASSTTTTKLIPVYFHVHGGGWKRGDRSIRFYGAPGVCHFACRSAGLIAVAPSYRLGHYPTFLHDVVLALKWVIEHIAEYGGDPSSIVLSGHSAGAHIVSLLVLHGDAYGLSLGDLYSRVKGVVLLSGVYSLHAPHGHCVEDPRNVVFRGTLIRRSFGTDPEIIDGAAPSCVLWAQIHARRQAVMVDDEMGFDRCPPVKTVSLKAPFPMCSDTLETSRDAPPPPPLLPMKFPFLVLNAQLDFGLEVDGLAFVFLLREYIASTTTTSRDDGVASSCPQVEYDVVPETNHASMCSSVAVQKRIIDFLFLNVKL